MSNYATELPTPDEIRERLRSLVDYWQHRNDWIEHVRKYLEGKNEIPAPEAVQYKIRKTHTGITSAAIAEKDARFMVRPNVAVIPRGFGTNDQKESTETEKALNSLNYWMEIQGEGDTWGRVKLDAIAFDMGVERIECIPAAIWPEITEIDPETEKERLFSKDPLVSLDAYTKMREEYKMDQGVPFRAVYVPPECFLPHYNGSQLMECFELETKSLRDVLANPLYDTKALADISYAAGEMSSGKQIKINVTIVHYSNHKYHAYYALIPASSTYASTAWPQAKTPTQTSIGRPVKLYEYEHNIGRCLYNVVGGRFGGWKTSNNAIEPVMNLITMMNQDLDEIASQVKTNIRATYWPTLKTKYDPEIRDATDNIPKPIDTPEGQPIALWNTEDLEPVFEPRANPILQWYYQSVMESIEKLAGSAAVYGQRIPGVDTGYHQNLQITQAEHLDERLEQNLGQGFVQRNYIILKHIQALGEKVWVHYEASDAKGRKASKYATLDPTKLTPLPKLDAQVRKPRPIDYPAATRAALDASMDRHGPGTPLLDDYSIRSRIMGEDAPDEIEKKIFIQNEKKKLIESGSLSQKIIERLNLNLVEQAKKPVNADMVGQADPALNQALKGINVDSTESAQMGGVSPEAMGAIVEGAPQAGVNIMQGGGGPSPYNGRGGGTPTGTPQPENIVGQALRRAQTSGR